MIKDISTYEILRKEIVETKYRVTFDNETGAEKVEVVTRLKGLLRGETYCVGMAETYRVTNGFLIEDLDSLIEEYERSRDDETG